MQIGVVRLGGSPKCGSERFASSLERALRTRSTGDLPALPSINQGHCDQCRGTWQFVTHPDKGDSSA
jgi:hypothetical protein